MKKVLIFLALTIIAVAASIPFWGNEVPPPLYGKVMFGLDSSDATATANFIVQGTEIYFDANKDDVPDSAELVDSNSLPSFKCDGSVFQLLELKLGVSPDLIDVLPQQLAMTVEVTGSPKYQQAGSVVMVSEPSQSNWLHIGGPISLVFTDPEFVFFKGETGAEVRIPAGSPRDSRLKLNNRLTELGSQFRSCPVTRREIKIELPVCCRFPDRLSQS